MIKSIDKTKCQACPLRAPGRCPVVEDCFQDVIRLDREGYPYIKYRRNCCNCHALYWFACQQDCPSQAVEVSTRASLSNRHVF
ncbi:MAG: hypothetical protein HY673_24825 [Chloroflexi bacterium]|nr:hypothetical protein [Chloroflexota bacterium]